MRVRALVLLFAIALTGIATATHADPIARIPQMGVTATPPGWTQFCKEPANVADCNVAIESDPQIVVLDKDSWNELNQVNDYVNRTIKPMTDDEHWGYKDERYVVRNKDGSIFAVDKWSYPTDGYGDCEDYVLLKRNELEKRGWPRSALKMTIVRDLNDEGHNVLTVVTVQGEFILDNLREDIRLWNETGYRFRKQQSAEDPNVWIDTGSTQTASREVRE